MVQPVLEGGMVGLIVLEAAEAVGEAGGDVFREVVDVAGGGRIEVVGGDGVLIDRRFRLDGADLVR